MLTSFVSQFIQGYLLIFVSSFAWVILHLLNIVVGVVQMGESHYFGSDTQNQREERYPIPLTSALNTITDRRSGRKTRVYIGAGISFGSLDRLEAAISLRLSQAITKLGRVEGLPMLYEVRGPGVAQDESFSVLLRS